MGSSSTKFYTQEQLNTPVIDGGANGILGRPSVALNFLKLTPRPNPIFYTVSLGGLMEGLDKKAIALVSEHNYDLRVVAGDNRPEYLNFCQNNLQIQPVIMDKN
jgi:hypothetical protein